MVIVVSVCVATVGLLGWLGLAVGLWRRLGMPVGLWRWLGLRR